MSTFATSMLTTDVGAYAFVIAIAQIGAAIALLNGLLVPLGQGNIAGKAIESIARQPEARGSIMSTMFIGLATSETSGIYGIVIAIILIFANPLVGRIADFIS
ncbi:MAG: ATP synthase F0 subunit C [Oscillospiraceae bacterium]|nr:ATP synthase F0 subunit C [Oscillospiraceae bacterium]